MSGDPFVIVLILVLGCAAFIFGIIYLIGRLFGAAGRGLMWVFRGGRGRPSAGTPRGPKMLICSREQCRKVELREGRFCGQCGAPLVEPPAGYRK